MALDLNQLGKQLDDALSKETPESMGEWLRNKRKRQQTYQEIEEYIQEVSKLERLNAPLTIEEKLLKNQ